MALSKIFGSAPHYIVIAAYPGLKIDPEKEKFEPEELSLKVIHDIYTRDFKPVRMITFEFPFDLKNISTLLGRILCFRSKPNPFNKRSTKPSKQPQKYPLSNLFLVLREHSNFCSMCHQAIINLSKITSRMNSFFIQTSSIMISISQTTTSQEPNLFMKISFC